VRRQTIELRAKRYIDRDTADEVIANNVMHLQRAARVNRVARCSAPLRRRTTKDILRKPGGSAWFRFDTINASIIDQL